MTTPIVPGEDQQPAAPAPAVAPSGKTRRRWMVPLLVGIGVLIVALCVIAALAPTPPSDKASDTTPPRQIRTTAATVQAPPPAPEYGQPAVSDFKLTVKTLRKECFGSAGCLVDFRIQLAYSGPDLDPDVTYEVTYEVRGGEDPLINTLEVTGTEYSTEQEETIETPSKTSKLKAVVTDVSEL